jgi:hypothetical protein
MTFNAFATPITVDRRMSLPNARWSFDNIFSFPPLFSLFNLEKHAALAEN